MQCFSHIACVGCSLDPLSIPFHQCTPNTRIGLNAFKASTACGKGFFFFYCISTHLSAAMWFSFQHLRVWLNQATDIWGNLHVLHVCMRLNTELHSLNTPRRCGVSLLIWDPFPYTCTIFLSDRFNHTGDYFSIGNCGRCERSLRGFRTDWSLSKDKVHKHNRNISQRHDWRK